MWTQKEAIDLCCEIEKIAPLCNYHVALTGGTLYKEGERKDVDILFYQVRGQPPYMPALLNALTHTGLSILADCGWCIKARMGTRDVDLFFPERPRDEWPDNVPDGYS